MNTGSGRSSRTSTRSSTRRSSTAKDYIESSTRRSSTASIYISTPQQHLAATVEIYPKRYPNVPPNVSNGIRKGFICCQSKVTVTQKLYRISASFLIPRYKFHFEKKSISTNTIET